MTLGVFAAALVRRVSSVRGNGTLFCGSHELPSHHGVSSPLVGVNRLGLVPPGRVELPTTSFVAKCPQSRGRSIIKFPSGWIGRFEALAPTFQLSFLGSRLSCAVIAFDAVEYTLMTCEWHLFIPRCRWKWYRQRVLPPLLHLERVMT